MTPSEGEAGSRRPSLTGLPLLIVTLGVVLVVQALFVLSYVGAFHAAKPRDLPFGVVGPSASPAASALGKQLSLRTTPYADERAALRAIDERKVAAVFVSGPAGWKLIVAPAAGPAVASAMTTAFSAAAAALRQKLEIVQVHRLPPGDSGGVVPFLVTMALVIGGYLSSTVAMLYGGAATGHRRLAALACAAVVGALLTDTLAGPVLGAIPTGKFFALWGLFALVMTAVAFATAALQTLFGPVGTLIVIVVFVIFGAPAAGGAVPAPFLPEFWRTLGPYLPAGAGTDAVRNTIYFDGNAIGRPLIVLTAYLVAGALAVAAVRRQSAATTPGQAEATEAAAATAVIV